MSFRDESGFTTVGMVLALLITMALVFTSAQVYRVNAASAEVQDVADAVALAAENEVAQFMTVVQVCDAVVLSLSLTGSLATGLGIAALCIPPTAAASETLLKAGRDVMKARNSFAEKAAGALNRLQKALPFFAAASGASVAAANNGGPMDSSYVGLAILTPVVGKEIEIGSVEGADDFTTTVDSEADAIRQAGEAAEKAAQEAHGWKEEAFSRDCGDAPAYCMYERAATLGGLEGAENPRFQSVDAWSFSVALKRAQTYYSQRLSVEEPSSSSVEEGARSALRERFYAYASSWVDRGYVHETSDDFEAFFPRLPKNTDEMRATELYTEAAYPVGSNSEGALVAHAWSDCPEAGNTSTFGSIAQMEQGGYAECTQCGFSAASLGKVAAASTSIENGFEYHYDAVARAAESYEKARNELGPLTSEVKGKVGGLFDQLLGVLKNIGSMRIEAAPPGRFGVIAFAVNTTTSPASTGFESGFVREAGSLGTSAALSAATLVAENSDEGKNVLSSLVDSWKAEGGAVAGVLGVLLDCWSMLLSAYAEGQESVERAVAQAVDALPFASASGLGTWAASALQKVVDVLGLQPAKLDALKPVIVNSAHVASADDSRFSAQLLSMKQSVIEHPLTSTDLFSSLVGAAETEALEVIGSFGSTIEIASFQPLGEGGPSLPLTLVLPAAVTNAAAGFVSDSADVVRSLYAQVTGVRVWE